MSIKSKARKKMLEEMKKQMKSKMGEKFKDKLGEIQEVKVMAPNKEGLEEGLSLAQQLLSRKKQEEDEDMYMNGDIEMEDDDEKDMKKKYRRGGIKYRYGGMSYDDKHSMGKMFKNRKK